MSFNALNSVSSRSSLERLFKGVFPGFPLKGLRDSGFELIVLGSWPGFQGLEFQTFGILAQLICRVGWTLNLASGYCRILTQVFCRVSPGFLRRLFRFTQNAAALSPKP